MMLLAEYLEHALQFERLAADETNPALKEQFEKQAKEYRKLAEKRAHELGAATPSAPESGSG